MKTKQFRTLHQKIQNSVQNTQSFPICDYINCIELNFSSHYNPMHNSKCIHNVVKNFQLFIYSMRHQNKPKHLRGAIYTVIDTRTYMFYIPSISANYKSAFSMDRGHCIILD